MRTKPKLLTCLILLGTPPSAHAATVVALNHWTETGRDTNNTFVGNGSGGFTETFGADTDTFFDTGASAFFGSRVTLSTILPTIRFSLTVGNITANAGLNNTFRIGFENDDAGTAFDATMHYVFGYGTGNRSDARFGGASGSNNEYAQGSPFDANSNMGALATPVATGNTVNLVVTLTYLGAGGPALHNYQATIDWDGATHTSNTFTRNTDSWDKVYVVINSNVVNLANDSYTVSNAQVVTIPEPASSAFLIAGLGGLFLRRNRRC